MIAMAMGALSWSGVADAQGIPGSVAPGRIQQQFQPPPGPAPTPEVLEPEIEESVPPTEAANIVFTLQGVNIDGSTVYSREQLTPLFKDLLGREVSLLDVYRVADAITTQYRSRGYVLSRAVVPAQRISNGEVGITVVEGFIHQVIIDGPTTAVLQAYADRIVQSRPLTSRDLQRFLLLINDLPGIQARAVLAPASDARGGADMTLMVTQKRLDLGLGLDNRGSKYIGPMELFSDAALNNPTGQSDQLSFRYITTPEAEAELRYVELGYVLPIGPDGFKFSLTGSGNESSPGSNLQSPILRTHARGATVTAKLGYPLFRSRTENLIADGSFTFRDSQLDQLTLPSNALLPNSYEDRIRILRAGISYDTQDRGEGRDFFHFEFSQGLKILDVSPDGGLRNTSRVGGRTDFAKATVDLSRLQSLNRVAPGLDLLTAASAAWSFGKKMLASEQFVVGGSQYGRGYDSSELSGDYGASAKIEFQYGAPLHVRRETLDMQTYSFYDYGVVGNYKPSDLVAPAGTRQLASTGAGFRLNVPGNVTATLELAKPLTRAVAAFADKRNARPLRLFVGLTATF